MDSVPDAAAIVARLPGWENASIRGMSAGTSRSTYLLEDGGRKAVLRTEPGHRRFPLNSRTREAAIQGLAHNAGIAPAVLYVDDTALLSEFAEGETATVEMLQADGFLRRLGGMLRKLHALPLSGRPFRAADAARLYAHRATARGVSRSSIEEQLAVVLHGMPPPSGICLGHNDLVAENIIVADELQLIDWEYAGDNDPLFDLAIVIEHHGLGDTHALELLEAYFGSEASHWLARLRSMQRVYRALTWLWGASRP